MKEDLIREADYVQRMEQEVLPYLALRRQSGTFRSTDGEKLYYEHYTADAPRAVVVMIHGFSEVVDKFRETAYYFLQRGYEVWQLELREHGRSARSQEDPALIYIDDCRQMVRDIHVFVREIVKTRLPRVLYGHSMGGGLSALYLECWPGDFERAVLTSPMLQMNSGNTPLWAAALYARAMITLGKGGADMPGSAPFSPEPDLEGSCTDSQARYLYWLEIQKEHPEFQMCVPAVRTALSFFQLTKAATRKEYVSRIRAKVLLLQAGEDTMVRPEGQERFIRYLSQRGRLVCFPRARHEIYRSSDEILRAYWKELDGFLEET